MGEGDVTIDLNGMPLQLDVGLFLGLPYLALWFLARYAIRRFALVRSSPASVAQ